MTPLPAPGGGVHFVGIVGIGMLALAGAPACSPLSLASLASSPAGGAKCTTVKPGKRSGKAKARESLPYHRLTDTHGRALASPGGGGGQIIIVSATGKIK